MAIDQPVVFVSRDFWEVLTILSSFQVTPPSKMAFEHFHRLYTASQTFEKGDMSANELLEHIRHLTDTYLAGLHQQLA